LIFKGFFCIRKIAAKVIDFDLLLTIRQQEAGNNMQKTGGALPLLDHFLPLLVNWLRYSSFLL